MVSRCFCSSYLTSSGAGIAGYNSMENLERFATVRESLQAVGFSQDVSHKRDIVIGDL